MIPYSECITNKEVELATPTWYMIRGSKFGEKGGVQVREMMESSVTGVTVREPTAERRPNEKQYNYTYHYIIAADTIIYFAESSVSIKPLLRTIIIHAVPENFFSYSYK